MLVPDVIHHLLLISVVSVCNCHSEKLSYTGYKIISVTPTTVEQLRLLTEYDRESSYGVEFWQSVTGLNASVVFLAPPHNYGTILAEIESAGMALEVLNDDVQSLIDQEYSASVNLARSTDFSITRFHRTEEIYRWLNSLPYHCTSLECQVLSAGMTHERRVIKAIRLRSRAGRSKSSILVECGIHAREWISPASCLYLINRLIMNHEDGDGVVRGFMEKYDVTIVPVFNPDGYEFTWQGNRFWRKNRRPLTDEYPAGLCIGVDLNRNWGYAWKSGGGSYYNPNGAIPVECSNTYPGSRPTSEPEIRTFQQFARGIPNLKIYLGVHAYGPMLALPWAYTGYPRPNGFYEMLRVARRAKHALLLQNGFPYKVGSVSDLLGYTAPGSSMDWYIAELGVPYAYAIELRGADERSFYGFAAPTRAIEPSGWELFVILLTMGSEAK